MIGLIIRMAGKFCFLLVIIGFFMPMACGMNGFQLANIGRQSNDIELVIGLYGLLITAIIGFLLGVLLLIKLLVPGFKRAKIPNFIDWLIILFSMLCGFILFFVHKNDVSLQTGVYVILAGYLLILLTQITSEIFKELIEDQ